MVVDDSNHTFVDQFCSVQALYRRAQRLAQQRVIDALYMFSRREESQACVHA